MNSQRLKGTTLFFVGIISFYVEENVILSFQLISNLYANFSILNRKV